MSVIIGYLNGEPQELTLVNGMVHINGVIQPIKNVTEAEIEEFAALLASAPEGDEESREIWRHTRRIQFLVHLMSRTFGDECTNLLEMLIGNMHYRVLEYLGETDDLDEYVEARLVPSRGEHMHIHGEHCGCHDHGHEHEHGHACTCGCHEHKD